MPKATNFPWITHRLDDNSPAKQGGVVLPFLAAATLLVGDVVFLSAADTVNKSATAANYTAFIGVVVGGKRTNGEVVDRSLNMTSPLGIQAALVGEEVLVQVSGVAYVTSAAAVVVGAALQVQTTSGQVDDPAVVAGQIVGTALDATGGSAALRMLIDHR